MSTAAVLLIVLCPVLGFSQINVSSDLRPVGLHMSESNGVVTFHLLNRFSRQVTAYKIRVWTFHDGVPKPACSLASNEVPVPKEPFIKVIGACAIPRNPTTDELFPYTAKLISIRVDGRFLSSEPLPLTRVAPR